MAAGDKIINDNPAHGAMKEIKSKLIKMMNIKDEEKTDIHFDGFKNEIAFKDASFGYEDDNRIVIDGMNLRLEKGKKYVIVGSSGSGKSTLIKLLLRYYDLNKGSITLDGTDVKRVNKNELYDLMAVIHQNVYMFDETLRDCPFRLTLFVRLKGQSPESHLHMCPPGMVSQRAQRRVMRTP